MNEEFNKFVEDIKKDGPKGLEDLVKPEELNLPEKEPELPEKDSEPRKNRHHRRLEQQLEREREARIAAEARNQAMIEMSAGKTLNDIDPILTQLYGNEERGKEAALLHQKLLDSYAQRAEEKALEKFQSIQTEREQEVKQFENFIDSEFEEIEDSHNVDLTSNAPAARKARNEMLELLEKISPKDDNGNITEYADMSGVYEMYQLKHAQEKGGASDRQKEVASRGMVKGDNSPTPEKKPTPGMRGWETDYGLK